MASKIDKMQFELLIMDLCEGCETAEEFRDCAETLHESVETAIQEMCWDLGIEDYEPSY